MQWRLSAVASCQLLSLAGGLGVDLQSLLGKQVRPEDDEHITVIA